MIAFFLKHFQKDKKAYNNNLLFYKMLLMMSLIFGILHSFLFTLNEDEAPTV